jgi:hypothetical protein
MASKRGGPTPSAQGAEVHFVGLNDGAKLPTKVTIRFGLRGMGVAPAGLERDNSGHHPSNQSLNLTGRSTAHTADYTKLEERRRGFNFSRASS